MNKFFVSFSIISVLLVCGYAIGQFSGLSLEYYMPVLLWFLALCIFYMFLDEKHVNIYLKTTELTKDATTKNGSKISNTLRGKINKMFQTNNNTTKNSIS
jgi:hypothetical protein